MQEKPFDLRGLLQNTADLFRDQAAMGGKRFVAEWDLREDWVTGDEAKVGQVVNNLLSNAFKYSNPGASVRLEARQFGEGKHSKYQIAVEDTGIGMSEGFLEHLFEPYTRETAFSANTRVGTGLGMPIVKNLVQRMNGEISVESELGKGSRFVVTLPMAAVEAKREPGAADAPGRVRLGGAHHSRGGGQRAEYGNRERGFAAAGRAGAAGAKRARGCGGFCGERAIFHRRRFDGHADAGDGRLPGCQRHSRAGTAGRALGAHRRGDGQRLCGGYRQDDARGHGRAHFQAPAIRSIGKNAAKDCQDPGR